MPEKQHAGITGAAGGIGRAIAEKYLRAGATVSISDINEDELKKCVQETGADGFVCDVGDEASVQSFLRQARAKNGPVDVYISNAGVGFSDAPGHHAAGGSNGSWEKSWQINVMSSVYAARALLPEWIKRKSGRFVVTASAAGLLAQVGSGSYTVTKHAALGFAEYLALTHKNDGISVHCICPQYVRTNMTRGIQEVTEGPDRHIEPAEVADTLFEAIAEERFLVLPHPVIGVYHAKKCENIDRYIAMMAGQKQKLSAEQLPVSGEI